MKFIAVAAVAAGLAIAGGASAATNLITNGSFEQTADGGAAGLDGWTLSHTGSTGAGYSDTVVIVTDTNNAANYPLGAFGEGVRPDDATSPDPDAAATHAVYFSSDVGTQVLTQGITLTPGKYEVGFDAYIPANGFNNTFDASFLAQIGSYQWNVIQLKQTAVGEKVWTHYFAPVKVTASESGDAIFTFSGNAFPAADVLVDRVYVIQTGGVPEPATWGLMIVGFGGIGAMMRSNRRRQFAA